MNNCIIPASMARLAPLMVVLIFAPAGLTAETCPEVERFALAGQAIDGDREAIESMAERAGESTFANWVLAAAHREAGDFERAAERYRHALSLGDELASLALAQIMHEAGRPIEAYAWGQVALWQRFDQQQIEAGAADAGIEMALLRASVGEMSEADNAEAEAMAGDYLKRWIDQAPIIEDDANGLCGWEPAYRQAPRFPNQLARRGQPGWVHAALLIDPDGETEAVQVLASSHRAFARQARRAMADWAFEPPEDSVCGTYMRQTLMFDLN